MTAASWPRVPLKDVAEIQAGFAWKSSLFSPSPDDGPPIIRIQNLGSNENAQFVYYRGDIDSQYWIERDEILVSLSGSFKAYRWNGPRALLNQRIVVIRPDNRINSGFLFAQLAMRLHEIEESAQGIAVMNASMGSVRDMEVVLPPIDEQQSIVRILDEAEAMRQLRARADERMAEFIPALFNQMFGDPATNPKGWTSALLGDVTSIDANMIDPRAAEYLDLPHIGGDKIESNTGELLPANTAREDMLISSKFLFDEHDVLYCKIRPYLRKVALPKGRGLCSADIYPVRPHDGKMTREYLWALLLSEAFTRYTEGLSKRANMPKINREQFAAYSAMLPPLALQSEFAARVAEARALQDQQARSRVRLEAGFQALLHRAFGGNSKGISWTKQLNCFSRPA